MAKVVTRKRFAFDYMASGKASAFIAPKSCKRITPLLLSDAPNTCEFEGCRVSCGFEGIDKIAVDKSRLLGAQDKAHTMALLPNLRKRSLRASSKSAWMVVSRSTARR